MRTLLAASLLLQTPSAAQLPLQWSWFSASTVDNGWWITKGRADVTISKGRFTAKLWDGDSQTFERLDLSGTINRNALSVRVTVNNSDEDPFRVGGKLTRSCWEGGGRETIVLTSGSDLIGLARDLKAGTCTPTP